jgi:DNA polymerase I
MTEANRERLFLIDSMSHIFRAYFAPMAGRMEPLTNSKGQVTQAVFIFTNMLRKLLQDEKPDYIAAIFESGEPTFRHDAYSGYKANRVEMPDDLQSQLPLIIRVCEVYRIPIINVPGFEADDVIGALAVQAAEKSLQAVIVSNDKDLCQLVRDPDIICMRQNSQIVKRKEPVPPIEWCDEKWVRNKFGVPPEKIVDLLGLMGDSVDNIPGAPGVGAKGAVSLVTQFGSVDEALSRWQEIKHKTYRESLRDNAELIRQSKELATIRTDVPVKLDLEQLKALPADRSAAYSLFRELEFQALTREYADAASQLTTSSSKRHYTRIKDIKELEKLTSGLWEVEQIGLALLGTDLPGAGQQTGCGTICAPTALAISTVAQSASLIDLNDFEGGKEAALSLLKDVLENGLISKAIHDSKRAIAMLAALGIKLEGVQDDSLLAAYLLDPVRSKYDLNDLAREALGIEDWTEPPEGWTLESWRTVEAADLTNQVSDILYGRILERGLETIYKEIEMPLAPLLFKMEKTGIRVDPGALKELSTLFGQELLKIRERIHSIAGREFNVGSPKQVGEVLEQLNLNSGRKTSTGRVSTSRGVLDELAQEGHEIARLIIEYRELDKLKSVYTDTLPLQIGTDGRIHSLLNQTVAATGRLSSSEPNLQNIPIRTELGRRIRRAFIADPGNRLISADYSQLELRLLAHVTHDPQMIDAFQKDDDIHSRTAKLVFEARTEEDLREKRRLAKIVNFAIAYAIEPFGLSQRVGITRKEAKKVIEDYFDTYKGVKKYMDDIPVMAREHGFVRSIYGRIRPVPSINDRNKHVAARAEREAINMPIQGTASDIVKIAMLRVDEALRKNGYKAEMIMQVHDELLVEAPEREASDVADLVRREMESAVSLDVPLKVDIGMAGNWMDAKH